LDSVVNKNTEIVQEKINKNNFTSLIAAIVSARQLKKFRKRTLAIQFIIMEAEVEVEAIKRS